ncbi:L-carnitine dehydratase/bile acid-inducible protein F [Marinobacter lipolyticus SM19]|uniref:L-carnitine dehydratase/bile acid-inducible protein F n=1 Tax=Marinobacter lipolyticus SM19 TaxID=1318628 RepID=R8B4X0_9GAMM|nr:CoA transferase [Marinobacter lipolyticus]EON93660.1 L-carnitine dehydratase/bile acid-inducible protein F [Marinobacter lipolyticus SM19]
MEQNKKRLPLEGIKVVDLTRVLSGPFCTALLSDLGAEIIKIEPPAGDEYRHVGPFKAGESALFTLVNRNKKGAVADLKNEVDLSRVLEMARDADVFVENFKPGVADRLGVGYDAVRAINPDIVYASISGFGQTGESSQLPAYDLVVQAMSGMMGITGEPGGEPTMVGESIADLVAGLYGSWAILAALFDRHRTGQGVYLDIAMLDCLFSMMPTPVAQWMFSGKAPGRVGNRHPLSTPFGSFTAPDGRVIIAILNNRQFGALCDAMGRPEIAADPRFRSDEERTRHEPELRDLIESWLADHTVESAIKALSDARIPASPVLEMGDALIRARTGERQLLLTQCHPRLGDIPMMVQPVRASAWATSAPKIAPQLGEHNDELFG